MRREGNEETKYNETSKLLLCPLYLRTSAPDSIPLLPWPVQMLLVRIVNQISGIFQVFRRLPAGAYVVVTGLLDEIMQLPIAPPGVEYAVDFPFLCFLDNHWVQF